METKKDLSFLEDNEENHKILAELARTASIQAIAEAKVLGLDITYLRGNEIVKESPDGKITVIGTKQNKTIKVDINKKYYLK
jgi:hypothetical protein